MISLALPLFYLTKLLLIVLTMKYETNLSLVSVGLVFPPSFQINSTGLVLRGRHTVHCTCGIPCKLSSFDGQSNLVYDFSGSLGTCLSLNVEERKI